VTKTLNRTRLSVEDDIVITTAVKEAAVIAFSGTQAAERPLLMLILLFVFRGG
jgi:hypothetical protein